MITYNNKNILKFFIGNKRVVKKYLNNKIVYGIPNFAQYYNIQGYDNYEVVGNLTIVDGVASGFSLIDYCKLNEAFTPGNNVWEEQIKFKLNYPGSNIVQALQNETKGDYRGVKLEIETPSSSTINIKTNISSNGTSWNLVSGKISGISFDYSKWGYILVKFTGTQYIYQFKQEGGEYTTIRTVNNSTAIYQSDTNTGMSLGCDMSSGPSWVSYVRGEIDLNETYIKVNENYWFNGNSNYKELLDCNSNVYLQSTGTQYINSGIYANSNLSNELIINFNGNNGQRLFGARKAYLQDAYALFYSNKLASTYGTSDQGYQIDFQKNVKNNIYRNKNNIYINGALVQTDPEQSFTTELPLYLFAVNQNNSLLTPNASYTKIYLSRIWNDLNLVQHLVPVPEGLQIGSYKVPSNGMFDIVEQKFYENKGSGEFIWGVDL